MSFGGDKNLQIEGGLPSGSEQLLKSFSGVESHIGGSRQTADPVGATSFNSLKGSEIEISEIANDQIAFTNLIE